MENYFKNRQEVEQFFKGEMFKFSFCSDNTIYFDTLQPIFLGDELFRFQLSFHNNNFKDFFDYSSFDNWLSEFQLFTVTKISEDDNSQEQLYFEQYKEDWKR